MENICKKKIKIKYHKFINYYLDYLDCSDCSNDYHEVRSFSYVPHFHISANLYCIIIGKYHKYFNHNTPNSGLFTINSLHTKLLTNDINLYMCIDYLVKTIDNNNFYFYDIDFKFDYKWLCNKKSFLNKFKEGFIKIQIDYFTSKLLHILICILEVKTLNISTLLDEFIKIFNVSKLLEQFIPIFKNLNKIKKYHNITYFYPSIFINQKTNKQITNYEYIKNFNDCFEILINEIKEIIKTTKFIRIESIIIKIFKCLGEIGEIGEIHMYNDDSALCKYVNDDSNTDDDSYFEADHI